MRAFLLHLAAYVVANAILFAINAMQAPAEGEQRNWWVVWPVLGWGIGVAAHGLALLLERKAKPGSLLADSRVRGFLVHAFVYAAVNVLLIAVDLVTTPGAQWFWWPLIGWGVGLAAHGFGVWRALQQDGERPAPAATQRASLATDSPWPESSASESPKTGETAEPAPHADEAPKPAPATAKRPRKRSPRKRATPKKKPDAT